MGAKPQASKAISFRQALEDARRFICSTCKMGKLLSENTLINEPRLRFDRPTARRVISELAKEGLLETLRKVGARVRNVTYEQLLNAMGLRFALEAYVAEQLVLKRQAVDFRELDELNRDFQERAITLAAKKHFTSDQAYDFLKLDHHFHLAVATAVSLSDAIPLIRSLQNTLVLFSLDPLHEVTSYTAAAAEHALFLKALKEGEPSDARRALAFHFENAIKRYTAHPHLFFHSEDQAKRGS